MARILGHGHCSEDEPPALHWLLVGLGMWASDLSIRKWLKLSLRMNLLHLLLDCVSDFHSFLPGDCGPVDPTSEFPYLGQAGGAECVDDLLPLMFES